MKIFKFKTTQKLATSLEESWDFFSNPNNLSQITPPDLKFTVTSELPKEMYNGLIITYTLNPLPLMKCSWVTEIKNAHKPYSFIDEQRFGPYQFWHHRHTFTEIKGGIEMEDVVHYGLGFGLLSPMINVLIIKKSLNKIFTFRRDYLTQHFGIL